MSTVVLGAESEFTTEVCGHKKYYSQGFLHVKDVRGC